MRIQLIVLLVVFLAACQPQVMNDVDHVGCAPEEITKEGTCELAEDGESNTEIFDNLNPEAVITETVEYTEGFEGYLAQPKAPGKYPGVIMIHEWWGLNDNIRAMAELLAQEGYVVLAVDLYGEVAEDSSKAGQLAGAIRSNPEPAIKNMRDAVAYLRALPNVNSEKIGSMGWCFGGGQSLQLALSGEEMSATVIYYGHLVDDKEKLSAINWPVLGIFGETDTGIPVESVKSFEKSLNELGIENEIKIYPGVGHAFANPSGARYAPEETKDAWEKTVKFLNENLAKD